MGLYYNPNPPHVGNQQPLEQKKLTPPQSGPPPQNPPLTGSRIALAILGCWSVAVATNAIAPVVAKNLNPPIGAVDTPLFKKTNYEIYRAWDAPPPAPIIAINLDPPVSGPDRPPILGARISIAVQVAWLSPPPAPIVAVNLDPPISGPDNPPLIGARVPPTVLASWLVPAAPMPVVASLLDPPISAPQNPPFATSRMVQWPADQSLPYDLAVRRQGVPTAPVAAANTPVGAQVPQAILSAWLAPSPAAIVARNLNPPISGPPPQAPPLTGSNTIPQATLIAWQPLPPQPQARLAFFIPAPVATPFPFTGSAMPAATLAWWDASAPASQLARKFFTPSGVAAAADDPPFTGGSRVPVEVQISWSLPSSSAPVFGPKFAGGATFTPQQFAGALMI